MWDFDDPGGSGSHSLFDLNGPGRFLHWSVFTVSLANLVLIAVMVLIFAAGVVLPFPGHSRSDETSRGPLADDPVTGGVEADAGAANSS